jgi:hypothetical protein
MIIRQPDDPLSHLHEPPPAGRNAIRIGRAAPIEHSHTQTALQRPPVIPNARLTGGVDASSCEQSAVRQSFAGMVVGERTAAFW